MKTEKKGIRDVFFLKKNTKIVALHIDLVNALPEMF